MLFLLAASCFVVYKFRWNLRWKFYKLSQNVRGKLSKLKDEAEEELLPRTYHAFVSYNHDKEYEWVRHCLLPKVEDDWGFKLCVGQRDFLAGAAIAENIVNAVENSHRTLIILTPDFLKSQWCDFELHMALTRGHQNVIICYIKQVDHKKLSNVMKRLIKSLTYIEYGEDSGHQEFWMKLHECLLRTGESD